MLELVPLSIQVTESIPACSDRSLHPLSWVFLIGKSHSPRSGCTGVGHRARRHQRTFPPLHVHLLHVGPRRGIDRVLHRHSGFPEGPHPKLLLPIRLTVFDSLVEGDDFLARPTLVIKEGWFRPAYFAGLSPSFRLAAYPRTSRDGSSLVRGGKGGAPSPRSVLPALSSEIRSTPRSFASTSQQLANHLVSTGRGRLYKLVGSGLVCGLPIHPYNYVA
mmetsp:Transcript_26822/g.58322  ORF Transcript_26822/g.58322 Transcript_26822/m.58322 type:complete len:218 (+) Transcript_26822:571-1224(+)